MSPLQVLIVDDEPIAQDIMEIYLQKVPGLQLAGKCKNALEAFSVLNNKQVDLILLDINMPEINGMNFIRSLKNPPEFIFTTAYSEFAVESYELDAIDYLVKPIAFERFIKAINKAVEIINDGKKKEMSVTTGPASDRLMFVKSEGKLMKIDLSKLWLVEGLKDYMRFWTDTGKIVVHGTMKHVEELLSGIPDFVRVNKSYIINLRYVTEIDGNAIRIKDQCITVGNTYREEVQKLFNNFKLL